MVNLSIDAIRRTAAADHEAEAHFQKELSNVGESEEIRAYLAGASSCVCRRFDAEARELLEAGRERARRLQMALARWIAAGMPEVAGTANVVAKGVPPGNPGVANAT